MTITVAIRDIYGKRTIYPVSDAAKLFAGIAGTITLTSATIDAIKTLGYTVVVQMETL